MSLSDDKQADVIDALLFLPKFMINVTTLILKLSISHF